MTLEDLLEVAEVGAVEITVPLGKKLNATIYLMIGDDEALCEALTLYGSRRVARVEAKSEARLWVTLK